MLESWARKTPLGAGVPIPDSPGGVSVFSTALNLPGRCLGLFLLFPKMGNDVLAEEPKGPHCLFVSGRPLLKVAHDSIHAQGLVFLQGFDASVGTSDAEPAPFL